MRASDDMPRRQRRAGRLRSGRGRIVLIVGAVALFLFITSLRSIASFYTDYLWFQSVDQTSVWRGVLGTKIALAVTFIGLLFVLLWVNLLIADRIAPKFRPAGPEEDMIERYRELVGRRTGLVRVIVAALFAILFGAGASGEWQEWLLFRNSVSFGIKDPQFHKDAGFYVFQLPFLNYVVSWLFAAFVIVFIVTAIAHYLNGGIRVQTPFQRVTPQVKAHLSVLLALLALVKAAGYYLQQFELTVSTRGTVDGPTYTDVHAQLPAIRLLLIISLFSAFIFLYNIFRRGWMLPVLGVGLWAFVAVIAGSIVPAFIQKFRVEPSESARERPYIERNIAATREAMKLGNVEVQPFTNSPDLTQQGLVSHIATVTNVRLWDPQITPQTYQQLQNLKPFYGIDDVDVDRYNINGTMTPVVLSARELKTAGVPQSSWEATHLAFTHGYGVVLAPANDQNADGSPNLLIRNIPIDNSSNIDVNEPGIYFGEGLSGYVITNTKRDEIDYQNKAGENVTTEYHGKDGIDVSSFIKKAAFALRFADFNPLVSGNVTSTSKILINRDINARLDQLAPFMHWDADPYPVVVNGRLQWIIDGYTVTDRFPNAQRAVTENRGSLQGRFNYVRNSVKAKIDAYDGTVVFYVVDHDDPIIKAWQKAFPSLFSSTEPSEELRAHFRYPEDLFRIQTNMWGRYHLENPDAFYTNADAWSVAPDPGTAVQGGANPTDNQQPGAQQVAVSTNRVPPYYQLMQLPGESAPSFLILRPFVPTTGNNQQMTAFMVAKSDPDDYGRLQTFQMPGNNQPPAPTLVASTMGSDPQVSQLQTLLGITGGGSHLLFGNLLTIPVDQSLIFVRPVYVQASGQNNPPLLRKVIVDINNTVKVDDTLLGALKKYGQFSGLPIGPVATPPPNGQPPTTPTQPPPTLSAGNLLALAVEDYNAANEALKAGDLATYQSKVNDANQKVVQAQELLAASVVTDTTTTTTTSTTVPSA